MQRLKNRTLLSLQIAVFVLGVCVTCSAQTESRTTASESQKNHAQQDSETLKALEIANIRLKAANETIALLEDRLKAKDATIEAREAKIALRDEQLALALSANKDRAVVNTGDARMLQACENQLAKADREISRLRNPGFFRSIFDPKVITGAALGFGVGRLTK